MNCLMPRVMLAVSVYGCIIMSSPAHPDESIPVMPETVVSPCSSGRFLSAAGASVLVLDRDDIESLPAVTLTDILDLVPGIDAGDHGIPGLLGEVSARGSSAEGVLVLVNGVDMRDPQTGHFMLDIPVSPDDIDRVEVLTGGGSSYYGASASGGVINIVTAVRPGIRVRASGGAHGTASLNVSGGIEHRDTMLGAEVHGGRSDGYWRENDHSSSGLTVQGRTKAGDWRVGWHAGAEMNDFGAEGFYGDWPSRERTRSYLASLDAERPAGRSGRLQISGGARGHGDDFVLVRDDPSFFENTHYTRTYTVNAGYSTVLSPEVSAVIGGELRHAGIHSGSLGAHRDTWGAVYGELSAGKRAVRATLGMRYDIGLRGRDVLTPGFGLEIPLGRILAITSRVERSFRTPTYTELYYASPANMGDPGLDPEVSVSWETGLRAASGDMAGRVSFFVSRADDVMDWVRPVNGDVWRAANHGRVTTGGLDGSVTVRSLDRLTIVLGFLALEQDVDGRADVQSKYVLDPAQRVFTLSVTGAFPLGIGCGGTGRYEGGRIRDDRTLLSLKLSRRFGSVGASLQVRNILDERYEEFPGLPSPGRWYTITLEYGT